MISFQQIKLSAPFIYMKDTIKSIDFNIHNITFTTYMTFLTSSKVSYIFHSYIRKVQ